MFGGAKSFVDVNDTWLFVNGSWQNLTASVGVAPPVGDSLPVAADPQGGVLLVVTKESTAETWELGPSGWSQVVGAGTPWVPDLQPMWLDQNLGADVLWDQGSGTWEFVNGAWSSIPTAVEPPTSGGLPGGRRVRLGVRLRIRLCAPEHGPDHMDVRGRRLAERQRERLRRALDPEPARGHVRHLGRVRPRVHRYRFAAAGRADVDPPRPVHDPAERLDREPGRRSARHAPDHHLRRDFPVRRLRPSGSSGMRSGEQHLERERHRVRDVADRDVTALPSSPTMSGTCT